MLNDLYVRAVRFKTENEQKHFPHIARFLPLEFSKRITILAGDNGTGKSTLLEALAVNMGCNPEGGGRNFRFETEATHSDLHKHIIVTKGVKRPKDIYFYRSETFYNVLTEMRRLDSEPSFDQEIKTYYGGDDLHGKSHGESMISLFLHRFKENGLYFIDEPEASLSAEGQLKFVARISELCESGAQFVLVTHSPIILFTPGAEVLSLAESGISPVEPSELDAVSIYKAVINSKGDYLKRMLSLDYSDG